MKKFLSFVLCFTALMLKAQINQPAHLIYDWDNFDHISTLNCSENGIILLTLPDEKHGDGNNWTLNHYDTLLQSMHTTSFTLNKHLIYTSYSYIKDTVYLLFKDENTRKGALTTLIVYDIKNGHAEFQEIEGMPGPISSMESSHQHLLFKKSQKVNENLYFYDVQSQKLSELKIAKAPNYNISYMMFDTVNQRVMAGLELNPGQRSCIYCILETDYDGKNGHIDEIPCEESYKYKTALMTMTDKNQFLIGGSYTTKKNMLTKNVPEGLYTITYDHESFGEPQYHPYADIPGLENISKKSRVHLRSILTTNSVSQFVSGNNSNTLLCDFYQPHYSTRQVTNINGGFSTQVYQDGYVYDLGLAASFDNNGNSIWNYVANYSNGFCFQPSQHIHLYNMSQGSLITFSDNKNLNTVSVTGNKVGDLKPATVISDENDDFNDMIASGVYLSQLTNNEFYYCRTMKVKNPKGSAKRKSILYRLDLYRYQ